MEASGGWTRNLSFEKEKIYLLKNIFPGTERGGTYREGEVDRSLPKKKKGKGSPEKESKTVAEVMLVPRRRLKDRTRDFQNQKKAA